MNVLEAILGIIAPPECVRCGREGSAVCENCQLLLTPAPPQCFLCSTYQETGNICRQCAKRKSYKSLSIACEYEGLGKVIVRQLKFAYERDIAIVMASIMADEIIASEQYSGGFYIVPLPTAPVRVRERSFDHTRRIAVHMAQELQLPCLNALSRVGQARQVGKSRSQRLSFNESNFYVRSQQRIRGRSILLIDDVVTTGATLQAAAKTLRKAGAKRVHAAVFAYRR